MLNKESLKIFITSLIECDLLLSDMIGRIMEDTQQLCGPFVQLTVPFPVAVSTGTNWADMHPLICSWSESSCSIFIIWPYIKRIFLLCLKCWNLNRRRLRNIFTLEFWLSNFDNDFFIISFSQKYLCVDIFTFDSLSRLTEILVCNSHSLVMLSGRLVVHWVVATQRWSFQWMLYAS